MSILLSAYFVEGIVFTADKNVTFTTGTITDVEVGRFTKVLAWPHRQALVGFCGLGELADLMLDEWLRIFIAGHRAFDHLDVIAEELRRTIEEDFRRDYPPGTTLKDDDGLIIHLGGFRLVSGYRVPAMYFIRNVYDHLTPTEHVEARFECSDDVEGQFQEWGATDYPQRTRERLGEMFDQRGHFLWFNNGWRHDMFNVVKAHVWELLRTLRANGALPAQPSLENLEAYCRMAVQTYDVFMREHYVPQERYVGGGVDSVSIPWPAAPPT